jgi:hypothetical protein
MNYNNINFSANNNCTCHIINNNGFYIIHLLYNDINNKLILYINNNLIEDSISYTSLFYCINLNKNDIITIKNNDNYVNFLNHNFKIYKL